MGDIYRFNSTVDAHSDCSYSSSVIGTISSGTNLEVTEIANGWYHTNKGWGYGFKGTSVIVEKVGSTTETNIEPGAYIKFNSTDTIKTIDGSYLPISTTNNTFMVTQISGEKTQISDGSSTYWVKTSDIKVTVNGTISVPIEVAQTVDAEIKSITSNPTGSTVGSTSNANSVIDGLRIKSLRGVYGMPYQYMEIADRRIDPSDNDSFGRKYAEKIVSKLPLLVMVPGSPEFLAGYSKKEKENILSYIVDSTVGESQTDLDSLVNNPGKYYGLSVNWTSYYKHVNPMCRAAARILNLQDEDYYGNNLGDYDWQKNANESIHSMLNYRGGTAFYINSETQISDSFANSTGQSMIAGKVNGISDIGREMNFMLGGAGALTGMQLDTFTADKAMARSEENKNDMVSKMMNGNNLMSSITNGLNTVIAGGKLIFPEIWSDSQFSRDYDISLKLVSPDCDDFSIYLNILVPILHLVGYVSPRSTGPNGYISPFLVRAFYKGLFNCDMGIITNMTINKGQEGSWTTSGLPTVVDVHFTIKELYSAMAITTNDNIKKGLLSNITLMDYIANLCGININEPDIKRSLYLYYSQYLRDKYLDKVYTDVAGGLDQWATNKMLNLFNR
jgi:hypothetical protein